MAPIQPRNTLPDFKTYFFFALGTGKAILPAAAEMTECFTCPQGKEKVSFKIWQGVSWLNGRHMFWAWISMIWVALGDIYVRLVAKGYWTDFSTWGN
jgi:hypothetical protein